MGQHAEDILDGTMCELCGSYFKDKNDDIYSHGEPVVCKDCWRYLSAEQKKDHKKATADTF